MEDTTETVVGDDEKPSAKEMEQEKSQSVPNDEPTTDANPPDEEAELEADLTTQNTSLKALTDGHSALQSKLQDGLMEQQQLESMLKELTEELTRQKEKNQLVQERVQFLSEKVFSLKTTVETNEHQQDVLSADVVDVNWKIQTAKQTLQKIQREQEVLQIKAEVHKREIFKLDDPDGAYASRTKTIKAEIEKLEHYKKLVEEDGNEVNSILTGNKMMELEERKESVREAIHNRKMQLETMRAVLQEKEQETESKKKSLEKAKERYRVQLSRLKNDRNVKLQTECRLQRSNEYLRQKIDYGMYVPAPPPWPEQFRSKR